MANEQNLRAPTSSKARGEQKEGWHCIYRSTEGLLPLREATQILMDADLTGKDSLALLIHKLWNRNDAVTSNYAPIFMRPSKTMKTDALLGHIRCKSLSVY